MEKQLYPLIENTNELLSNLERLDNYLASTDVVEVEFANTLIKRGICFVCVIKNSEYRFYPSRFVGYKNNSMSMHNSNTNKDGRLTNPRIESILEKHFEINDKCDLEFYMFCRELGIDPYNKKRKYLVIE